MENKTLARNIRIGQGLKDECMSWSVTQKVKIGTGYNAPIGIIEFIIINDDFTYEIHVKKGQNSFLWKKGNMPFTAEYSTDYN